MIARALRPGWLARRVAQVFGVRTRDEGGTPSDATPLKFYAPEQLSAKRRRTHDGFVVIEDVPVARVGDMIYGPDELKDEQGLPIEPGWRGLLTIERHAEDVFRPETIASLTGKSITIGHPPEDVDPASWAALSKGIVINPRRGTGADEDVILADLMLTTRDGIEMSQRLKHVSVGYDAKYIHQAPGRWRQTNIIANHLALVPYGRCGVRCAIGDRAAPIPPESTMSFKSFWARLRGTITDATVIAEGDRLAEQQDEPVQITVNVPGAEARAPGARTTDGEEQPAWFTAHVEQNNQKFAELTASIAELKGTTRTTDEAAAAAKKLEDERKAAEARTADEARTVADFEGRLEAEAPHGYGVAARKARDSAYLQASFQDAIAGAEILAPGIQLPAFDQHAAPKVTLDAICGLRRRSLDYAYIQPDLRVHLDQQLGGQKFDLANMTCDAERTMFRGAVAFRRQANNTAAVRIPTQDAATRLPSPNTTGRPRNNAELNAFHEKYYGQQAQA